MKLIQITFFVLFISCLTFAQSVEQRIDSLLKATHQQRPEVTINLGYLHGEKSNYFSIGNLSRESNIPSNENTLFEIASITKMITSHLIGHAVLDKKLHVNDFIDKYLSEGYQLQESIKNRIRISDLASHQSDLPDIDFRKLIKVNSQQPTQLVTEEMCTQLVNNCSELIDYGNYRYSTIGFVLLGQILENVYGKSYDQILEEKFILPAKMTRTFTKDFEVNNTITGYNPNGGEQELFVWNITAPAGLIKSTSADMVSYLQLVLDQNTDIAKAAQITERTFYNKQSREIGLGTNIIREKGNTLFLKTGDSLGQSSIFCYDREHNWGIILFINENNGPLREELFYKLYKIIKRHI